MSTETTTQRKATAFGSRRVWLVSALAGVAAAVATEVYGLLARAVGVPMSAGSPGAAEAGPITVGLFAMGTVICVFWGTVLAVLLARYAANPARTYLRATLALTVVSLASPLAAAHTAGSTKLMLAVGHLIAAAIVIPVVTRRLATAPGRNGRA
ncbi:hypothetical protein F0L68_00720 [Solihabitans fulvus]|uniref:Uncharacterized protein n=1 Tax=Solihabitans fulvus TaxID=1892852 RepID=A0A5B2XT54_9PSEU|nr:DUF6069 family protein [Solihabitans fulvus]KAA2267088.1 hypothetical protein F0L68_00720 [Solihabitans fulvus]